MSAQTAISPYLNFNGNCKEAMNFYKDCLEGNLELSTFADSPMEVPDDARNNVLHSTLTSGNIHIMASDAMDGQEFVTGNNISLSLNCSSREELDKLFDGLGAGGNITMPKQDTFWGAYFGMLTDKFGVNWMFNYDSPGEVSK